MERCEEVSHTVNRHATRYAVFNTNDVCHLFQWLIDDLSTKGKDTPKVIIFCRSKKLVSETYENLKASLGENAYHPGEESKDYNNCYLAMFHHKTRPHIKALT